MDGPDMLRCMIYNTYQQYFISSTLSCLSMYLYANFGTLQVNLLPSAHVLSRLAMSIHFLATLTSDLQTKDKIIFKNTTIVN